jgi:hypothetical protein
MFFPGVETCTTEKIRCSLSPTFFTPHRKSLAMASYGELNKDNKSFVFMVASKFFNYKCKFVGVLALFSASGRKGITVNFKCQTKPASQLEQIL